MIYLGEPSTEGHDRDDGRLASASRDVGSQDLLSDVLRFVQLRGGRVENGAIGGAGRNGALLSGPAIHVVQQGTVRFTIDGRTSLDVAADEIVVVPHGSTVYSMDPVTREQPRAISATFQFENAESAAPLLGLLPHLIHITPEQDGSAVLIKDVAQFLVLETEHPEPGSSLMISRVIDILVIRCIRTWARSIGRQQGWVGALADVRISRAVAAMHRDFARDWSIVEIAAIAGMSRSAFAERFLSVVGVPPLRYLHNWRLTEASELLRRSTLPVGEIGRTVGYESEAAFSRAFKIKFGVPPGKIRMNLRT